MPRLSGIQLTLLFLTSILNKIVKKKKKMTTTGYYSIYIVHYTPCGQKLWNRSNTNKLVQLEDIKTERGCSTQCTERTRVLHHSSLGLHCRCPDILSYPSDVPTLAYCACAHQYYILFLTLNNNI